MKKVVVFIGTQCIIYTMVISNEIMSSTDNARRAAFVAMLSDNNCYSLIGVGQQKDANMERVTFK